jgi:signal transduction histidine kinase
MSSAASLREKITTHSPMAQLLHALNQPLTGLQCSMEVALASPRTAAQYVLGLREGLQLTERMRALAEAMREIVDIEEEKNAMQETSELTSLLREAVEDLNPVAESRGARIVLVTAPVISCVLRAGRAQMASAMFRLVDSAVSLSSPGTAVRIEAASGPGDVWIRIEWQGEEERSALSRPELGLLIAQARLERAGAQWQRERMEDSETLTIRVNEAS